MPIRWQVAGKVNHSEIHSQLKSKVPSLRSQHGPNVSAGQAYITNVMLNVPGAWKTTALGRRI